MSIRHVGLFPFQCDWGRGPITRLQSLGVGSGGVTASGFSPGPIPVNSTDWPFAMTKTEAMRQFWKIRSWELHIATPFEDITREMIPYNLSAGSVDPQRALVACQNGFVFGAGPPGAFQVVVSPGVTLTAYIQICTPRLANGPQIYFNNVEGWYVPRISTYVSILDDGSATGRDYTLQFGTDPDANSAGLGDTFNADYDGLTLAMEGDNSAFGPVTTLTFTPTLW